MIEFHTKFRKCFKTIGTVQSREHNMNCNHRRLKTSWSDSNITRSDSKLLSQVVSQETLFGSEKIGTYVTCTLSYSADLKLGESSHHRFFRFSRSATTRNGNSWSHLSFCMFIRFIPHFLVETRKTYHESLQARNPPSFQENMRRFDVFAWGKAMQDCFFCEISAALQTVVTRIAALVPKMIEDELSCLFLKWRSLHVWGTNKKTAPMTFPQA